MKALAVKYRLKEFEEILDELDKVNMTNNAMMGDEFSSSPNNSNSNSSNNNE